ncbi:hypothetical protein [Frankia sp. Cas4]|uniref:hypothetical protein n=1 Tax=Frankia sp. Cas4 TaxID=3073927 RepID=UPI002AD4AF2F|nr:hypothetical protein [Frankia sp. Cas4]
MPHRTDPGRERHLPPDNRHLLERINRTLARPVPSQTRDLLGRQQRAHPGTVPTTAVPDRTETGRERHLPAANRHLLERINRTLAGSVPAATGDLCRRDYGVGRAAVSDADARLHLPRRGTAGQRGPLSATVGALSWRPARARRPAVPTAADALPDDVGTNRVG